MRKKMISNVKRGIGLGCIIGSCALFLQNGQVYADSTHTSVHPQALLNAAQKTQHEGWMAEHHQNSKQSW